MRKHKRTPAIPRSKNSALLDVPLDGPLKLCTPQGNQVGERKRVQPLSRHLRRYGHADVLGASPG